jgi:nitroreductase
MKFLELVKKRRSCRQYASRSISLDIVQRCLEAARWAPSACNSQPWRFIVLIDTDLRRRAVDAAFSGVYAMNGFAKEAAALVVVVREKAKFSARLGGLWRGVQYSLIDVGIACDHFTLQAAEEGLGSCWLGWFDELALKKVLDLSHHTKIDVLISLGYPLNESVVEKSRKSINEMSEIK